MDQAEEEMREQDLVVEMQEELTQEEVEEHLFQLVDQELFYSEF